MEVWIFADFKLPDPKEIELLTTLNITDVVLGIESEHRSWRLKYSEDQIVETVNKLHNRGLQTHLMCWISRDQEDIIKTAEGMLHLAENSGCKTMLLDAERHWHKGPMLPNRAAALIADKFAGRTCKLGVTGLANINPTIVDLLKVCDYGLPQAYSIWKPEAQDHWSRSISTEPGCLQIVSWDRWMMYGKPLVMGLSCYWAARPPRYKMPAINQIDSMNRCLGTSKVLGAGSVAYWSLKHLHKNKSAEQRADFIRSIRGNGHAVDILLAQELLVKLGYDLGIYGPLKDGVDGKWGRKSQAALTSFRLANDISRTGIVTNEDITLMQEQLRI
jgi:hypothetical protein